MKNNSIFYGKKQIENINFNISNHQWAENSKKKVLEKASSYLGYSYQELWNAVFGSTLKRSWSVWSDGYCPCCRKSVPLYKWEFNPIKYPWKAKCPHCNEFFPKNDFYSYYKSGIDNSGIFRSSMADKSLLYNVDHPCEKDPLHLFGVDDGNGYIEESTNNCWYFIATYLIYGQWKGFILDGIKSLAASYILTEEKEYARRAAILLDRLADLFGSFDFETQGILYEGKSITFGFITYWCDSCFEVRDLAIAYDQIFDAIKDDAEFVTFLKTKSEKFKNIKSKNCFNDIQNNIESGIFDVILKNSVKIHCNYPQTEITLTIIKTVLSGLALSDDVEFMIDRIIENSTKIDGVTGEKGLIGYSAIATQALGSFLARYVSIDSCFLEKILKKYPILEKTFRFHIDTWCLKKYYPLIGDCGFFGMPNDHYIGLAIKPDKGMLPGVSPLLEPSMPSFMLELYQSTKDPIFVQVLKHSYPEKKSIIPWDMSSSDIRESQKTFNEIIEKTGKNITIKSVNKEQWHLALLRSGKDNDERVLWLDYDSGGFLHSHADGMNIGLMAKGLDLMPDFGYPPVQYGGWETKEVNWYKRALSHNTVVAIKDNEEKILGDWADWNGRSKIWAITDSIKVVSATNTDFLWHKQFQRTLAMVDISEKDSYILDVFRAGEKDGLGVTDGKEWIKLNHFTFGDLKIFGLDTKKDQDLGKKLGKDDILMRNFMTDTNAKPGWYADFKAADYYELLSEPLDIHLRYTDLTVGSEVSIAEAWVNAQYFDLNDSKWIPCIVSRKGKGKKTSNEQTDPIATFACIMEPYENESNIREIKRLNLSYINGDSALEADVAIEVVLKNGKKDLLISVDCEDPLYRKLEISKGIRIIQEDWDVEFSGELCIIRKNFEGMVESIFLCNSSYIRIGDVVKQFNDKFAWIEGKIDNNDFIISNTSSTN